MKGVQLLASRLFRRHGFLLARYPLVFVLIPFVVAAFLTIGLVRLTIDSDPNLVWVPPDSTVNAQKLYFDNAFDPFFRVNQIIISLEGASDDSSEAIETAANHRRQAIAAAAGRHSSVARNLNGAVNSLGKAVASQNTVGAEGSLSADGAQKPKRIRPTASSRYATATAGAVGPSGILTQRYMKLLLDLQSALVGTADSAGTVLDDVCYKPIAGKGCLIESPLDYFRSDPTLIVSVLTPRRLCSVLLACCCCVCETRECARLLSVLTQL